MDAREAFPMQHDDSRLGGMLALALLLTFQGLIWFAIGWLAALYFRG